MAGCGRKEQPPVTDTTPLKATYITPEFNTVIIFQVDRILKSPLIAELRAKTGDQYYQEMLKQFSLKYNIEFQDVNKFTMMGTSIADSANYHADIANIVHFNKAMDLGQVNEQLIGENAPAMFEQRAYFRSQHPRRPAAYWPEKKTVVTAPEHHLKQMISSRAVNRPLVEMLERVEPTSDAIVAFSIQAFQQEMIQDLKTYSDDSLLYPLIPALNHLKSALLSVDLTDERSLRVEVEAHHGASAAATADILTAALNFYKKLLDDQLNQLQQSATDSDQLATIKILRELLDPVSLKLEGNFVVLTSTLSADQLSRLVESVSNNVLGSADRHQLVLTQSRLDQIGSGIFQFHKAHGRLPVGDLPPIKYRDGKPLLSWRVHLLPFLQEQELYQQFHLDEPWDSEHNIKLIKQIPHVYTSPQHGELAGQTTYLAAGGKGTVFGSHQALSFKGIRDGLKQTILVVQVGPDQAVPWTKPEDLTFTAEDSLDRLGKIGDQLSSLFADGRVFHINSNIKPGMLHALFQYQDGQRIDRRRFQK